jgi:hypothetical protein
MPISCITDFFSGNARLNGKQCPYCVLQISFSGYVRLNGKQCPYFAITAGNTESCYNFPSVLIKFTLSVIILGNLKQNSCGLCF